MLHQKTLMGSKSQKPVIASIGVSNFELGDMKRLLEHARIPPHIYQGNSWLVFHDPWLTDLLHEHNIFFQAYSVMNNIIARRRDAPTAYNILSGISREIMAKERDTSITEATVVIAYFIHSNVGVIPRAASDAHQRENSPKVISKALTHLTPSHIKQLELAIPSLMKGEDVHTSVSFLNALTSPIQIHWLNPETNEEVLVSNTIHPGSVETHRSHPGHRFVAYDPDRSIKREFTVDAQYGEQQHFKIEL